ncbi:hybrid sensor histidine kinase/response regulator [Meridianimarinicoccus roseus]|uniref:histidine kinase n=1 Tax=Meridianimarinicoccus roseus TaxID=2072018 RepID=A0A2V2LJZ7_9RHOB|nr:ATP-binding protein [Meridianimarinicoccus roseus]PWR03814.1 hybrid sensor histidine kinase/response regulator [Meridianimarinicoccus roseus]
MIDPSEPQHQQIARQSKIIDALVRRATRQNEVGQTAYSAFQSAIELQAQVAAKNRDLKRAETELESVRYERERTRKNLDEALSAMGEGFALFIEGKLDICNALFRNLLPDVADRVQPGLSLPGYFNLMAQSGCVQSTDRPIGGQGLAGPDLSLVIELTEDRWYQVSAQRTSLDNLVLLLTEISAIVRQNRSEREHLIDLQADYLQAVFENMTSGVCTFSASGEVMMHNVQFRQLLGLPYVAVQKGMTLKHLLDYMAGRGLIADDSLMQVDSWQERLNRLGRFHSRVRSGLDRVFDMQANLLPDGGFLVEIKDVTLETRATQTLEKSVQERTAELTRTNQRLTEQYEQKARVEEELRLAKERAEAAVSSKTRFLAAASHDLLQPINAAKLLISTLQQNTARTPHAPLADRLKGAFTSIENLLHALLDISRLDSTERDTVVPSNLSLDNILQGVFEDQTPLAEQKGVRLRMVPCRCHVRSDPVYLLRSVQNLVVNAIQYTPRGGSVLIGCRRRGGRVELQVWDTGIGIAEPDQSRIFEEFARAANVGAAPGVGLGLSIVERTCRHLGHRLWMTSELGVGSVFSIEMDMVADVEATSAVADPVQAGGGMPLDHIALVVENDDDVLFATTQTLQAWGASVLPASSTEEALTFVRDMGIPPDIMLVDYQLDGEDTGLRAIAAIRAATGTAVPAIMITADRSERLRRAAQRMDFTVMTKPVQLRRLRPLIEWKVKGEEAEPKVGNDTPVATSSLG